MECIQVKIEIEAEIHTRVFRGVTSDPVPIAGIPSLNYAIDAWAQKGALKRDLRCAVEAALPDDFEERVARELEKRDLEAVVKAAVA